MRSTATAVLCLLALAPAGLARAQTISVVTTPTGSYSNSVGIAIAKVISDKTKYHAIVQAESLNGMFAVEAGNANFSMANAFDTTFFATGTGEYEGKGRQKNLREVATMIPYRVGIFVRANSSIKSMADLKGKRVPAGFDAQKTIGRIVAAHLANAGLSYDDVQQVLTPNIKRSADDFIAGKTDVLFFTVGSAAVKQASASVGGLRALQIDDSPQAVARLEKVLPGAYVTLVKPAPNLDGISVPTKLVAFDMAFFANKSEPDNVVYAVTKALHENKPALVAIFRPFGLFQPNTMAKVIKDVPFHPGALKYYKEIGIAPK